MVALGYAAIRRPQHFYLIEFAEGSGGDPAHHFYLSSITSGGCDAWATDLITRFTTLYNAGRLPPSWRFMVHCPGGLRADASQVEGIDADAHATLGQAAMVAALIRIRNACALLNGLLILYSGWESATLGLPEANHPVALAPLAGIGVPLIMDSMTLASAGQFTTIDAAAGQSVGLEGPASLTSPASALQRLSYSICGIGAGFAWDPATHVGGLETSLRADTFPKLPSYTGEIAAIDSHTIAPAESVRITRNNLIASLQLSVIVAFSQYEADHWNARTLFSSSSLHSRSTTRGHSSSASGGDAGGSTGGGGGGLPP